MDADRLRKLWQQTRGSDPEDPTLDTLATYKVPTDAERSERPRARAAYELGKEIGRGGVGRVCEAVQTSLSRTVALKSLLPAHAGSEASRASFLAEAEVTGSLEHPNIVPVYDLHTDEQTTSLVLKMVRGRSWKEDLTRRPGALVEHLEVLQQVCNAVAYAHSRGILHNDLKPANVMLGSFGEVLVMDWGLAVSLQPVRPGSQIRRKEAITAPCGTPAYMPIELAEGRGADLVPQTDVYLLGAILYRILSGRPPHRGDTVLKVLLCAVDGAIEPLDPSLPEELRSLCMRALEPRPQDRWPSVLDFQRGLRTYLRRRESLQLADKAWERLRALQHRAAQPDRSRESLEELYDGFAETLHGFENARALDEHPDVLRGAFETHLSYARCALDHGDLGLAEAQLRKLRQVQDAPTRAARPSADEHAVTLAQLEQRVQEVRSRRAWERRLRRGWQWSAVLLLLAGVVVALLAWEADRRALAEAITERRTRVEERLAPWTPGVEQALAERVRARLRDYAGQADPEQRRELAIEERKANADLLQELLRMIADFERALDQADEPVEGEVRTILEEPRRRYLREAAARYRADAFALALLNDAFDLGEVLVHQADLSAEDFADAQAQLEAARSARVRWQLTQTRAALEDVRSGRQRADRQPGAYDLDEYATVLSAFQHPRIARELAAALEPYTRFAAEGGDPSSWTQAQREEIELILEVLGFLRLPDESLPALTSFLTAVDDPLLARACARSLCNTRRPEVNALLVSRDPAQPAFSAGLEPVRGAFARVPTPAAGTTTAARVWIARLHRAKRAPEQALQVLAEVIADDPDEPWAWFHRATVELDQGRYAAAIASLDEALARGLPEPGRALLARAFCRIESGDFDASFDDLDAALEAGCDIGTQFRFRGLAFLRLDRPALAVPCFTRAIATDLDDPELFNLRGVAHLAIAEHEQAEGDFTRALSLAPDLPDAFGNRGSTRLALRDWGGALADLDQAVRRQPRVAHWRAERARTRIHLEQLERARADIEQAAALDPGSEFVRFVRAEYLLASGAHADARELYEQLAQVPGYGTSARIGLAHIFLATQQPEAALAMIDELLVHEPTNAAAVDLRVSLLWQMESWDAAIAASSELLRVALDPGREYVRRAMILLDAGEPARAREDLVQAQRLLPDEPQIYALRSRIHTAEGDFAEALADIEIARRLDPSAPSLALRRAAIFIAAEEFDAAEEALDALTQRFPDFAAAHRERGALAYSRDAYDLAIAAYSRALELEPGDGLALLFRGYSLHYAGRYEEAIVDLTEALERHPEGHNDLDALLYRGEAWLYLGRPAPAMEDFARAVALYPDEGWAYAYRALGHCATGAYEATQADLARARALGLDEAFMYTLDARVVLGEAHGDALAPAVTRALALLEAGAALGLAPEELDAPELAPLWEDPRGRAFRERVLEAANGASPN